MQTTDSQQELLIEVDEQNNVIGPISRGVAHASKDKYYRTVYAIVMNNDEKILTQKRSATKDLYPNKWDLSVGGHVGFGQSYEDAANRELLEELGIKSEINDLKYKGEVLVTLPLSHEYFHIFEYMLKSTDQIKKEIMEINETKWMSMKEITDAINNDSDSWYPRPEQVIRALYR